MKFKSRREAKDRCRAHHPGSPITEIGPGAPSMPGRKQRGKDRMITR